MAEKTDATAPQMPDAVLRDMEEMKKKKPAAPRVPSDPATLAALLEKACRDNCIVIQLGAVAKPMHRIVLGDTPDFLSDLAAALAAPVVSA